MSIPEFAPHPGDGRSQAATGVSAGVEWNRAMFNGNVLLTLGPALLLSLVHVWAALLHPDRIIARKYWLSFADGVSITYIFLQLLSEITELIHRPHGSTGKQHSSSIAESIEPYLGWLEHYPFLPLLAAVVIFYGLERLMEQTGQSHAEREVELPPLRIWIHLAGFSFYKMLIGYILAGITDPVTVTVFTIAMAMHFFVVDIHLVEIHPHVYTRIGRWMLGVALLVGWGIGIVTAIAPLVLALMLSFVSGGAILMVIQEEFSERRPASYGAFLLGVVIYSGLLFML
jgi:hypothetical protein